MQGETIRKKMRTGLRLVAFLAVCLFLAAALSAANGKKADEGSVKGVLVEKGWKTPVGSAVVRMKNLATGNEYLSAPTDERGRFEIAGVEEGRYRLEVVSAEGTIDLRQTVFIKANELADFNLDVAPDELAPQWDVAQGVYGVMEIMYRGRKPPSPKKPPGKPPWAPGPPPWHHGPRR